MLATLRRIIEEVSAAPHRDEALAIIVRRVSEAMSVDACSVYLVDASGSHFVLMASNGFDSEQLGISRVKLTEGLIGAVGERRAPVNLAIASEHPRFSRFAELVDARYPAFLGVPLIHLRRVLGVLAVQRAAANAFSPDEVAFLVTIAGQLAGAINDVTQVDAISRQLRDRVEAPVFLRGIPAIPGVAIGTMTLPDPLASLASVPDRIPVDMNAEEVALRSAVLAARTEIRERSAQLGAALSGEAGAILDAYVMLLDSNRLITAAVERIHAGNWAPGALRDTIAEYSRYFEQIGDPYLRARSEDIRGVGRRVLMHLQSRGGISSSYPERCILMGEEIGLAQMSDVPVARLAGTVSTHGSAFSHAAILARSLEIPAVMGIGDLPIDSLEGATAAIDGYRGRVFINPSRGTIEEFEHIVAHERSLSINLQKLRDDLWVNGLAIIAGLIGIAFLIAVASPRQSLWLILSLLLYRFGLTLMLICSALYNGGNHSPWRDLLRRLDHAAIFVMIAGSYTPFLLEKLKGTWSHWLLICVWAVAGLGVALKLIWPYRFERLSVVLYLFLGWTVLVVIKPLFAAVSVTTFTLLAAGGVLYSIGVIFHLWERLPYQQPIWHCFVVAGAACHYAAIFGEIALPGTFT